jgi:hypothetical protein
MAGFLSRGMGDLLPATYYPLASVGGHPSAVV